MHQPTSSSRAKLLGFLQDLEAEGAPPPSIREICKELGFKSTNAASELIHSMVGTGEVIYQPGRARSLRLRVEPMKDDTGAVRSLCQHS